MKTYNIMAKDFECPVIKAESPEEAMLKFATSEFDSNLNTYFKAVEETPFEPYFRVENIVWDLSDIEDEAEAFSIMKNLPKSEDVYKAINAEDVADYLSETYGYCVKSYTLGKDSITKGDDTDDEDLGLFFSHEGEEYRFSDKENFFYELKSGNIYKSDKITFVSIHDVPLEIYSLAALASILDNNKEYVDVIKEWKLKNAIDEWDSEEVLSLLASTMPDNASGFSAHNEYGEPEHWMDMPKDRALEIVFIKTDDKQYYSWRVHCSSDEFDNDCFTETNGVVWENTTEDFSFDARFMLLTKAIKAAKYTLPIKPVYNFKMGEEIELRVVDNETYYCGYVIDYIEDRLITVVYPDLRKIIKYEPDDFKKVYNAKTGATNDLVNALF